MTLIKMNTWASQPVKWVDVGLKWESANPFSEMELTSLTVWVEMGDGVASSLICQRADAS